MGTTLKAWDARASTVAALRCTWETSRYECFDLSRLYDDSGTLDANYSFDGEERILFDGERYRIDVLQLGTDASGTQVAYPRTEASIDGIQTMLLPEPQFPFSQATVAAATSDWWESYQLVAIGFYCRGSQVIDTTRLQPTGTQPLMTERVGLSTQVLTTGDTRIWVSDDARRLPVQLVFYRGNKIHYQWEIWYREDPNGMDIPTRWLATEFGVDGKTVLSTISAHVSCCEVNPKFTAGELNVEFPDGTLINEGDTMRIIREGKDDRVFANREFAGTAESYDALLNSENLEQIPQRSSSMLWIAIAFAAVVVTGLFGWRRFAG